MPGWCFLLRRSGGNAWASEVVAAATGATPVAATGYTPGPFAFADPAFVGSVALTAGWQAEPPVAVEFAYLAGEGDDPIEDALNYFTRIGPAAAALRMVEPAEAMAATQRLRAAMERRLVDGVVTFPAMAWVWSMQAV